MSEAPFDEFRARVRPEWIDYNHHLNVGYYEVVFDQASDEWLDHVGLDQPHRDRYQVTTFTLESHTCFLREVREGDLLRFKTLLLGFDSKRIHYIHEMHHADAGYLAATNELMSLHVGLDTRRAAPMHTSIQSRLESLLELHRSVERPPQAGRRIELSRQRS